MKRTLLITFLLCHFLSEAQKIKEEQQDLDLKLKKIESKVNKLSEKVNSVEEKLKISEADVQSQIDKQFEVQAQNEKAVNLALDGFSQKFEDQNKTMDGVKSTLEKQWDQQLMIFGLLFLVFMLALIVAVRIAVKRTLANSKRSWAEFEEYVVSGKFKNN